MVLKMFAEFETANQDARLIESYICQRDLYLRSVSYTHLDVYKRQVPRRADHRDWRMRRRDPTA